MPNAVLRCHLVLLCTLAIISLSNATDVVNFNRDIKPILSDKCYACHGPDEGQRQGGSDDGLRFDVEAIAKSDLGGYAAIVPGKIEDSELVRRILSEDPDEIMPPPEHNKTLKPAEIQLLKNWIKGRLNLTGINCHQSKLVVLGR